MKKHMLFVIAVLLVLGFPLSAMAQEPVAPWASVTEVDLAAQVVPEDNVILEIGDITVWGSADASLAGRVVHLDLYVTEIPVGTTVPVNYQVEKAYWPNTPSQTAVEMKFNDPTTRLSPWGVGFGPLKIPYTRGPTQGIWWGGQFTATIVIRDANEVELGRTTFVGGSSVGIVLSNQSRNFQVVLVAPSEDRIYNPRVKRPKTN